MTLRSRLPAVVLFSFALSLTFFATQSEDVTMYLALARDFIFGPHRGDVDPYLYSRSSATLTWTHEWLSYVLYYAGWLVGGVAALILIKVAVLAATFRIVLGRTDERTTSPLWAALWVVGMTAASFRFVERSSAFLELFVSYLVARLLHHRRWTRALALELGVLFLSWAQLHPSYPLGFAVLGMWILHRRSWSAWIALPVLAPLANPDGWRGFVYPLTFAMNEGRVLKEYNFEWFPTYHPAFRFAPETLAYWVFALVALTLLVRERRPRDLRSWFVAFALVIGTMAVRFVPAAVFVTLIAVKPWAYLEFVRFPRWLSVACLSLLFALSLKNFALGYESSSGPRRPRFAFDDAHFPKETLEFLRAHRIPGRVYNSHDYGSLLIWENMAPVFHHGFVTDVPFYRDEVVAAISSPDRFFELAAKYEWTMLLIEKRNAYRTFYAFLKDRPEWKIVAEDNAAYLIYKLPDGA